MRFEERRFRSKNEKLSVSKTVTDMQNDAGNGRTPMYPSRHALISDEVFEASTVTGDPNCRLQRRTVTRGSGLSPTTRST
ncbi:hypothetical protein F442_15379 [Phytophthora nicotianae P10297]|uniref:Uncharacterized protein n=1 Tax=Phytophthora nicotianae P10297 TaxID=1317064 RepID=W2YNZ3_PHYNI|nr:hypothetical protein F442_15379 [Phytophthora nicotianae P10297]